MRPGKNGINRNFYEPDYPEYSWHPYSVSDYVDIVSPVISTWPNRLETEVDWSNPNAWNQERPVAFDELTVVRELGPNPVFLSVEEVKNDLHFTWNLPNTNGLSFTLESSATVGSGDWRGGSRRMAGANECVDRAEA